MTNPIPEYIDKQNDDENEITIEFVSESQLNEIVREFVTAPVDENDRRLKMMVLSLVSDLRNVRGDHHSAQEEITKLNSWLKNAEAKERHYDELRRWFNDMEERAVKAEKANKLLEAERDRMKKERDYLMSQEYLDIVNAEVDRWKARAIQAEQELERADERFGELIRTRLSIHEREVYDLKKERNALLDFINSKGMKFNGTKD
jgi:acyl-homoserine lactone acylase PvdQ